MHKSPLKVGQKIHLKNLVNERYFSWVTLYSPKRISFKTFPRLSSLMYLWLSRVTDLLYNSPTNRTLCFLNLKLHWVLYTHRKFLGLQIFNKLILPTQQMILFYLQYSPFLYMGRQAIEEVDLLSYWTWKVNQLVHSPLLVFTLF